MHFPPKTIFVALALSPDDEPQIAQRCVDESVRLAEKLGATLMLATVVPPGRPPDALLDKAVRPAKTAMEAYGKILGAQRQQVSELLQGYARAARTHGIETHAELVEETQGVPHSICTAAEQAGADLVVVASHGRRGIKRFLIGSVAERVVQLSPVPVVVLPIGDELDADG